MKERTSASLLLIILFVFCISPVWSQEPHSYPWLSQTKMVEITVPDTTEKLRIEYVQKGKGPDLILLHGFGAMLYSWRNNIEPLSKNFTVYAYNHLGAGNSNNPFPRYDLDAFKSQLLYFMNKMKIKKAILVGNSMGCQIALAFAGDHPERVNGIVLIDPSGGEPVGEKYQNRGRMIYDYTSQDYSPAMEQFIRETLQEIYVDDTLIDDRLMQQYINRWNSDEKRKRISNSILQFSCSYPQVLYEMRSTAWKMKNQKTFSHQALIIWGQEDPWFPVQGIQEYLEVLKGAESLIVENAGHLPHEEKPVLVNERIIRVFTTGAGKLSLPDGKIDYFLQNLAGNDKARIGYSALILSEIKEEKAIPLLMQKLGVEDNFVQFYIEKSLKAFEGKAVEPLLAALQDTNVYTRKKAVLYISHSRDPRIFEPLLNCFRDKNGEIRMFAVMTIGEFKDKRAVPHLIPLLIDKEGGFLFSVDYFAKSALTKIGAPGLPDLFNAMNDPNPEIRKQVADILGDIKDSSAVPVLVKSLQDSDANVKHAAIKSLSKIGLPAYQPLVDQFATADENLKLWVIYAIGQLRLEAAQDLLINLSRDPNHDIRFYAAMGLGELKSYTTIPVLIPMLDDKIPDVRNTALESLVKIGSPAFSALWSSIENDTGLTRQMAAKAIGRIGGTTADSLFDALKHKDPSIRIAGVLGLKENYNAANTERSNRIISALILVLDDPVPVIRDSTSKVLAKIGNPAVSPLIDLLKDPVNNKRRLAASILGQIKNEQAVLPLIHMIPSEQDTMITSTVAYALGTLGDKRAVLPLIDLLRDNHWSIRLNVVWALGSINDTTSVQSLINVLQDKNLWVRYYGAEALGKIKDKRASGILIATLQADTSEQVRYYAAWGLGEIKDMKSVKPLIRALTSDRSVSVRTYSANALGKIKDKQAVPALIKVLKDNDAGVRLNAALALGEIKDRKAVQPLIDAFTEENKNIFNYIGNALRQITATDIKDDPIAWKEWWEKNK